jgi:hypothetical protein
VPQIVYEEYGRINLFAIQGWLAPQGECLSKRKLVVRGISKCMNNGQPDVTTNSKSATKPTYIIILIVIEILAIFIANIIIYIKSTGIIYSINSDDSSTFALSDKGISIIVNNNPNSFDNKNTIRIL